MVYESRLVSGISGLAQTLVKDFGWIHEGIGAVGNLAFLAGSVLFLPALKTYQEVGVWLFIVGSLLMAVGAVGRLLLDIFERKEGG